MSFLLKNHMLVVYSVFGVSVYFWSTYLLYHLHVSSTYFGLLVLFTMLFGSIGARHFDQTTIHE